MHVLFSHGTELLHHMKERGREREGEREGERGREGEGEGTLNRAHFWDSKAVHYSGVPYSEVIIQR